MLGGVAEGDSCVLAPDNLRRQRQVTLEEAVREEADRLTREDMPVRAAILAEWEAEEAAQEAKKNEILGRFEFVAVPPGVFEMGSGGRWGRRMLKDSVIGILRGEQGSGLEDGRDDERPSTKVRITKRFGLSKHEASQELWEEFMGSNPSQFSSYGATCPVENVSWNEVQEFILRLNEHQPGVAYRLPTEAEWEYAARAGTNEDRYGKLKDVTWCDAIDKTRPVGLKRANAFGLHDMLGNVSEWVADWYEDSYPGGHVDDPTGSRAGRFRVNRGGAAALAHASAPYSRTSRDRWRRLRGTALALETRRHCRANVRFVFPPDGANGLLGFRVARDLAAGDGRNARGGRDR